jgi:hypothetical protein
MVYCALARDSNYPGRPNPQKEKDNRAVFPAFSAVDSDGRDRFCMTPEQPE